MPHYFQRYSQRENWVTNSTLLLLSRLNYFKREYFEGAINILLGGSAEISTQVIFDQQISGRGSKNIIDGLIQQQSFALAIETKLYDNQYEQQLTRHLESLRDPADVKILIALSVNDTPETVLNRVRSTIIQGNYDDRIKVVSTTYVALINAIRDQLNDRDTEMLEILDDYARLCEEQKLISLADRTILAVPVGDSIAINLRHRIYYHPAIRNYNRSFDFIGFYNYWHIRAVGKVQASVAADLVDGKLVIQEENPPQLTSDQEARIIATIQETSVHGLTFGIRFYLLDEISAQIAIRVSSPIMKAKYFIMNEAIELASPEFEQHFRLQFGSDNQAPQSFR